MGLKKSITIVAFTIFISLSIFVPVILFDLMQKIIK